MIQGIKTCPPDTTNRQEIYQAALEAVAFQNREVLEAMEKDSKIKLTTILSDGGNSTWLLKVLALMNKIMM